MGLAAAVYTQEDEPVLRRFGELTRLSQCQLQALPSLFVSVHAAGIEGLEGLIGEELKCQATYLLKQRHLRFLQFALLGYGVVLQSGCQAFIQLLQAVERNYSRQLGIETVVQYLKQLLLSPRGAALSP